MIQIDIGPVYEILHYCTVNQCGGDRHTQTLRCG